MWTPSEPYNGLPSIPTNLETIEVLKAVIPARAALAALNQALDTIPNPGVLISTIPLLEAQASSEIENIFTTTDELFRYSADIDTGTKATPAVKETLRYRGTLYHGAQLVKKRPITANTAIEVCSSLRGIEAKIRDLPGTYIGNPATKQVRYTPPEGRDRIAALLSQWQDFINKPGQMDPLVVMAAAHYQFEAIHPFADGNGRTGRMLNVLYLLERGLLNEPVLYLSRYIIQNKAKYYQLLLDVTASGQWQPWLLFMLEAVRDTADSTLQMVGKIQTAQDAFRDAMRATAGAVDMDLLDVLFMQPYARVSNVVERCAVSRPTATKWLRALVTAGLLNEIKIGRENLFVNAPLLEALQG